MPGPDQKNPDGSPRPLNSRVVIMDSSQPPPGHEEHMRLASRRRMETQQKQQEGKPSLFQRAAARLFASRERAEPTPTAAAVEFDTVRRDPTWPQTARGERPATSRFEGPPASPDRVPGTLPFEGPPATSGVQGPPAAAAAGAMHYQTVLHGPPSVSPQRKGPNPAAGPQH